MVARLRRRQRAERAADVGAAPRKVARAPGVVRPGADRRGRRRARLVEARPLRFEGRRVVAAPVHALPAVPARLVRTRRRHARARRLAALRRRRAERGAAVARGDAVAVAAVVVGVVSARLVMAGPRSRVVGRTERRAAASKSLAVPRAAGGGLGRSKVRLARLRPRPRRRFRRRAGRYVARASRRRRHRRAVRARVARRALARRVGNPRRRRRAPRSRTALALRARQVVMARPGRGAELPGALLRLPRRERAARRGRRRRADRP